MPKKISDLTAITSIQSLDYVEIARGSNNTSVKRDIYDEFSDNIENINGLIWNISLAESRSASAVTVFLKQKDGTDLSSNQGRGRVKFRSSTAANGTFSIIDGVATTSTTISAGNTIGFVASKDESLHIYSYNDAGTLKIAYSGSFGFDEGELQNITAQGSVATVKTTLFAATSATAVAVRYMGKITYNLGTPGTWVTAPTAIVNVPVHRKQIRSSVNCDTGNGHGSTDTKIRRWTNATTLGLSITRASSAGNGDTFTINEDGEYALMWCDVSSSGSEPLGFSVNSNQLTTSITGITAANRTMVIGTPSANVGSMVSYVGRFVVGDIIRCHDNGGATSADANSRFVIIRIGD